MINIPTMFRVFRYPMRPTKAQEATLTAWLGQCCDLYNAALQERRGAWKKQRVSIGYNAQTNGLTEWRRLDPDGGALPVEVQRSALRRIDLAFKAFFRRVKSGQAPGYPRFKSKRRYDSLSVPTGARNFCVCGNRISLPKLPGVRFHLYRPMRGKILDTPHHPMSEAIRHRRETPEVLRAFAEELRAGSDAMCARGWMRTLYGVKS